MGGPRGKRFLVKDRPKKSRSSDADPNMGSFKTRSPGVYVGSYGRFSIYLNIMVPFGIFWNP